MHLWCLWVVQSTIACRIYEINGFGEWWHHKFDELGFGMLRFQKLNFFAAKWILRAYAWGGGFGCIHSLKCFIYHSYDRPTLGGNWNPVLKALVLKESFSILNLCLICSTISWIFLCKNMFECMALKPHTFNNANSPLPLLLLQSHCFPWPLRDSKEPQVHTTIPPSQLACCQVRISCQHCCSLWGSQGQALTTITSPLAI